MPDAERLTDERVRGIVSWFDPDYADDPLCNTAGDVLGCEITEGDLVALAREVLAARAGDREERAEPNA